MPGDCHPVGFRWYECETCRAEHARRIREIKAELPVPEYDWEDLAARDRRSRENPLWYLLPVEKALDKRYKLWIAQRVAELRDSMGGSMRVKAELRSRGEGAEQVWVGVVWPVDEHGAPVGDKQVELDFGPGELGARISFNLWIKELAKQPGWSLTEG